MNEKLIIEKLDKIIELLEKSIKLPSDIDLKHIVGIIIEEQQSLLKSKKKTLVEVTSPKVSPTYPRRDYTTPLPDYTYTIPHYEVPLQPVPWWVYSPQYSKSFTCATTTKYYTSIDDLKEEDK